MVGGSVSVRSERMYKSWLQNKQKYSSRGSVGVKEGELSEIENYGVREENHIFSSYK